MKKRNLGAEEVKKSSKIVTRGTRSIWDWAEKDLVNAEKGEQGSSGEFGATERRTYTSFPVQETRDWHGTRSLTFGVLCPG